MAPIWKPQSHETVYHWWNTIVDEAQDSLNEWELNFISNLENRIRNGMTIGRNLLTEAQEKKLEQIYAEKTK